MYLGPQGKVATPLYRETWERIDNRLAQDPHFMNFYNTADGRIVAQFAAGSDRTFRLSDLIRNTRK